MESPTENPPRRRTLTLAQPAINHPQSDERISAETRLDSTELLRGRKAIDIDHNGATYRLQATRLGKLILTK